jgi:lysophospholipase L1-like esterase
MSRRTTVLACLVISSLLTLVVATPASAAVSRSTVDYVAMGDSFTAGVGAPGQVGLCLQSANSYAGLWAKKNKPASFYSLACVGAVTRDVQLLQVPLLSSRTDLITISVGGNDAGFVPAVISCTLGSESTCAETVQGARATISGTLPAALDRTYRMIKSKAPKAKVYVMGYPRLFDETDPNCGIAGLTIPKRRLLNDGADDLSGIIAARAAAAGFTYVDVRETFQGHGACTSTPWINPLTVIPPQNSFHPNTGGYAGYLSAFAAALN